MQRQRKSEITDPRYTGMLTVKSQESGTNEIWLGTTDST